MTPEGKVKRFVSAYLKSLEPRLWYYMPVQTGYGKRVLDYIGCYRGRFFAIETKPGKETATDMQKATMADMEAADGVTFLINNQTGLQPFMDWIAAIDEALGHAG